MQEISRINGPSYSPMTGNKPKQLVILCHGVGADGSDLIGLAPYFAKVLPDAVFVAPNGPEPYDMAPVGHQWFSLIDATPDSRLAGTRSAAPILDAFIGEQLAHYELQDKDLALVGFSQGTMMALHVAMRRARPMAGVIGYSGALIGDELLRSEVVSRPPVLLIHGDMDDVVPPDALDHAVRTLAMAGITVTNELRPGLGHGLDDRGIMVGMDFLAHVFDVPLPKSTTTTQDNQPPAAT